MSGSGTDKTKSGVELRGPVVILVEPQLGENIGMTARAMGNFALTRLRIVNPRDGWPNVSAQRAAAGADAILDRVELFDSVEQAVADLTLLFATTARAHDQAKPVVAPEVAAREIVAGISRRRQGRHPVRPRAVRPAERGGRARRPHHHLSGQSRLCLAQPRAGGAADGL